MGWGIKHVLYLEVAYVIAVEARYSNRYKRTKDNVKQYACSRQHTWFVNNSLILF